MSAAHVFEQTNPAEIYYYSESNVKRFLTGSLTTNRHFGSRETDRIDLAAVQLSGTNLPPYLDVEKYAIPLSWLKPKKVVSLTARYGLVGFPASRSRTRNYPAEIRVSPYGFIGMSVPASTYAENGVNQDSHICLHFDRKRSFGLDGAGRSFPKPHGISGSPIFLLFDQNEANPVSHFLLVGVATTWIRERNLLIGTGKAAIEELVRIAI